MAVTQLLAAANFDHDTGISYSFCRMKNRFTQLHCHDFYEIVVVTSGTVKHFINGSVEVVGSNSIIFIRPQDIHYFNGTGPEDFEYINLAFTPMTLTALLHYLGDGFGTEHLLTAPMPPSIHLAPADTLLIRKKAEKLSLFPAADREQKKAYFRLLIGELFFSYFFNRYESRTHYPLWLDELMGKINEPDNFSQGVFQLEKLSGKSLAYISRVFKETLQTTPTDYINDLRLNYCADRLIHSDAGILDIAMDAGFNNLSHFYHLFKIKYNLSPGRYRKEHVIRL